MSGHLLWSWKVFLWAGHLIVKLLSSCTPIIVSYQLSSEAVVEYLLPRQLRMNKAGCWLTPQGISDALLQVLAAQVMTLLWKLLLEGGPKLAYLSLQVNKIHCVMGWYIFVMLNMSLLYFGSTPVSDLPLSNNLTPYALTLILASNPSKTQYWFITRYQVSHTGTLTLYLAAHSSEP